MLPLVHLSHLKRFLLQAVVLALVMFRPGPLHADDIRIVTAEEPPTNFTQDGQVTGIVADVVNAILGTLHQDAAIAVLPWARAYHLALNEPNVVIFTAGRTRERIDHGFHFVGPVTTRRHTLYARAGQAFEIAGIEDISRLKLRIGAMRGDWRGMYFREKGIDVEDVSSHLQALKMLLHKRIDFFVSSDLELGALLRTAGVERRQVEPAWVFQERDAFIMLSKGTPAETVTRWQEAFAALRGTDFFERTARKWSTELGVPLRYAPEKGFYLE